MSSRKKVLHGIVSVVTTASVQQYIITIRGEIGPHTPAEAKAVIFKAVKNFVKEIPGAAEFWVSQPRSRKKNGDNTIKPRASRAVE